MYIYIFYNLKSNRNDSTWVFPWWCSNFLDDHPPSNSLRSTWKGKRKSELSLSLFISLVLLGMYSGSPRQEIPLIAKCHMPTKMMASQDQMTCPWLFIARQIWPFISPLYHQDQLPPVHCQKLQDARACQTLSICCNRILASERKYFAGRPQAREWKDCH